MSDIIIKKDIKSERHLDQFYTNNDIALKCYTELKKLLKTHNIENEIWLEPSAGAGAFFNLIEYDKIGIDIDPKIENVIKADFLEYILPNNNYITIGNPPFGRNSNLAIRFFNKCSEHSKIIGFIIPKTFKKASVINKLNYQMHLIYEMEIPANSFNIKNEIVNVPCIFQVWIRKEELRSKIKKKLITEDFIFTTRNEADIAFQRVGTSAGVIKDKSIFDKIPNSSHLFIKIINPRTLSILQSINWDHIKYNTAGNPSVSKSEIIHEYELITKNLNPHCQ